jgi:hypothetical protein
MTFGVVCLLIEAQALAQKIASQLYAPMHPDWQGAPASADVN